MWSKLFSLAIEDDSADGIHFCIIFPSVSKVFMRKHLKMKELSIHLFENRRTTSEDGWPMFS